MRCKGNKKDNMKSKSGGEDLMAYRPSKMLKQVSQDDDKLSY